MLSILHSFSVLEGGLDSEFTFVINTYLIKSVNSPPCPSVDPRMTPPFTALCTHMCRYMFSYRVGRMCSHACYLMGVDRANYVYHPSSCVSDSVSPFVAVLINQTAVD